MFYTKYRPQKFSTISRPNQAADALALQVAKNKIGHAYLFVGPRGIGKTTTARILAKALNCENLSENGDPCDECMACVSIRSGSFMDMIEIDAASNRGIDDIRELKNKVKLAPGVGKNKVYIIDEVHMLTNEAFNALLKTLEEPPARTVFILCTTEFNKIPETIKSRCQVFKFRRASVSQIVKKLRSIAEEENISMPDNDLEMIAKASFGGFRDAETLLEQASDGEVDVGVLLNIGSKENFVEFVDYLILNDAKDALQLVNKVYDDGVEIYVWVGELIKYLRELLFVVSDSVVPNYDVTDELDKQIKAQSEKVNVSWIVSVLEELMAVQNDTRESVIPQLPVELAIVKLCSSDGQGGSNENTKSDDRDIVKANSQEEKENKTMAVSKESRVKGATISSVKVKEKDKTDLKESEKLSKSNKSKKEAEDIKIEINEEIYALDLSEVLDKWEELLSEISKKNNSLHALLKTATVKNAEKDTVFLEVYYSFHKERIETQKNRRIVEEALESVLAKKLKVSCAVNGEKPARLKKNETGILTDYNVVPSEKGFDKKVVIEMLDGGLPMI